MTAVDTTSTDHSQARADGAHTHGGAPGVAPQASRAARLVSFDVADFPTPTGREEEWRFTPLKALRDVLTDAPVDGHLEWSVGALPAGVSLIEVSMADAANRSVRAPGDRASALAVALSGGAQAIVVAPGTEVAEPIVVGLRGTGGSVRGHVLIEVGAGAEATVVIEATGSATYSEFLSIDVADGASLTLVLVQAWAAGSIHASDVVARIGRDASLRGSAVSLGGAVVRMNTSAIFAGEGGKVDLFGLSFAGAHQHIEHRVFVDHAAPRCRSRVTHKNALAAANARTVWIGDVLIRAVAQGTDTYELNRNLILADGARADSVPNLEIETGDIDGAGHASATGRFDEEQMFYLRSRGIPEGEARRLVVRGFFADLIHEIGVPSVEVSLMAAIDIQLESVHG